MIDHNDLWIGDLVRLKKSGRTGKYEGIKDGKARININSKIVLSPISNLELVPENKNPIENLLDEEEVVEKDIIPLQKEIDLHIEKLNSSLVHARPEQIIDHQVKSTKNYIESVIKKRFLQVKIIHGKGNGVLKSEVHHLLSLYDEVSYHLPENDGGATVVLFAY